MDKQANHQSKNALVEVSNLNVGYNHKAILKDITFSLQKGEYIALIGENGSGKSTLMKTLLGQIKPLSGSILMFGAPLQRFRDWYKIGYVPQTLSLDTVTVPIRVEEILKASYNSASGSTLELRIQEVCELTNTSDILSARFGELSGGQRQRVMIARSLINQPELLILDEPTSSVDEENRLIVQDFLVQLNTNHHKTIIHITHDIDHIESRFSRILCIDKSMLCQQHPHREHIHS